MEQLPTILPVFRVRSTILMPGAQLPIVMSENDCFAISSEIIENNIIAIIQPKPVLVKEQRNRESSFTSFTTGCAGRITEIMPIANEVTINIFGLCRFEVLEEFPADINGIERVSVSYEKFSVDTEAIEDLDIDRPRLMNALDLYFRNLEIAPNWKEIDKTPTNVLVSALAMSCPFHPSEKQSLLETVDAKERSNMIIKIIEMNSFDRYNTANIVN